MKVCSIQITSTCSYFRIPNFNFMKKNVVIEMIAEENLKAGQKNPLGK